MEKLGPIDRKLLCILAKDARMAFKDVATMCGVSRAAIHQRVQKLTDDGLIMGSSFLISEKVFGYNTCAYVGLKLEKGNMYKEVVAALEEIPEVVECYFTTGQYTMMLKLFARDNEHLMHLLNDKIQSIRGVMTTETHICLEQGIRRTLPVEE